MATITRPMMAMRPPIFPPMRPLNDVHQLALYGVRPGDCVLVENFTTGVAPRLYLVGEISSAARDILKVVIKATFDINADTVFDIQRYGTWRLECMTWNDTEHLLGDSVTSTDVLTLNPPVEMLNFKYLQGKCVYRNCILGLVHKSPITVDDVHFLNAETRRGREVYTLCPYCMGPELQKRHECLVTSTNPEQWHDGVIERHFQSINTKRAALGYPQIPDDADLICLSNEGARNVAGDSGSPSPAPGRPGSVTYHDDGAQAVGGASRPNSPSSGSVPRSGHPRRFSIGQPIHSRHSSSDVHYHWDMEPRVPEPRLSSHSLRWYETARDRVLHDVCGICQESYQEGDRIVNLKCEHFWHESCLLTCFDFQRNQRKKAFCPLCRRKVES